jgi:exopolysaccharide production protein ExoQ
MRWPSANATRTAFLVLVLFTVLAGDAWRYTLSWWGWGVIAVGILAGSVVLLVRRRSQWRWSTLPLPLYAFLGLAALSIAWSAYRPETALGVVATAATIITGLAVAIGYSWTELLRGLGIALRIILGASLLFELVVAVFVRHPIFPFWVDYGDLDPVPKLLYWSRNELFEVFDGGRIQGIVGNASTLAFMALLAAIVFGVELAARTVWRAAGIGWLAVAGVVLLFTRSATITVALLVVAAALGAALLVRAVPDRAKFGTSVGLLAFTAAVVVVGVLARGPILRLLGRSDDLTNRLEIWDKVVGLAVQRPAAGWGWVGYWPPWVPPFDNLLLVNGVQVMHAHNAWLDVWLQLGVIGLVVFGALVLSTASRAWLVATDRPEPPGPGVPYRAIDLLPLLLLVALLVQSLAESRLLVEYGLLLLVVIATVTKRTRT